MNEKIGGDWVTQRIRSDAIEQRVDITEKNTWFAVQHHLQQTG